MGTSKFHLYGQIRVLIELGIVSQDAICEGYDLGIHKQLWGISICH